MKRLGKLMVAATLVASLWAVPAMAYDRNGTARDAGQSRHEETYRRDVRQHRDFDRGRHVAYHRYGRPWNHYRHHHGGHHNFGTVRYGHHFSPCLYHR